MKILFITAHPYLPQMYGGLQTSTDQLCRGLMQKGHSVAVLAALTPDNWTGLKSRIKMHINNKISGHKLSKDMQCGYPVWRSWFPWELVALVAQKEKPDLIVVLAAKPVRMALAARESGIPIIMLLQDVAFDKHDGPFEALGKIPCIANSRFTADKYRAAYGVDPTVIYPFIAPDRYRTKSQKENITFINPVEEKGCGLALEIARLCPDIPFSFIEGWPLTDSQRSKLKSSLRSLPNVRLLPPAKDMKKIYGRCRILLVPSLWEEAYGMVVTEAQISGIPVVASIRGGLPEAVGPGGMLLDPNGPISDWVTAVRKLWQDDRYYAELSAAALAHAQRPEMELARQIDAYEKLFLSVTKSPSNNKAYAA